MLNKYVIERTIPGLGDSSESEFAKMAEKSNAVLSEMGTDIKWHESYATDDKMYCIYSAKNEEVIRDQAERGGFPVDRISEVKRVLTPETADTSSILSKPTDTDSDRMDYLS